MYMVSGNSEKGWTLQNCSGLLYNAELGGDEKSRPLVGFGLFLLFVMSMGIAACGDSPTAPTDHDHEHEDTDRPAGELTHTLSSIQSFVFNPSCVAHHGEDAAEAGLNLAEGHSFDNLVNVRSTQVALDLVRPGDAENSYLVHKLDGRAGIVGERMPVGGPFLTATEIDVIKEWINEGAEEHDDH